MSNDNLDADDIELDLATEHDRRHLTYQDNCRGFSLCSHHPQPQRAGGPVMADSRWWLWLGVFLAVGNFAVAVVSLFTGDLLLSLLGVCVGFHVAIPLWERREHFTKGQPNAKD